MTLSAYEKETVIQFDESSNKASIYTCSKKMMTKLDKLCKDNPDTYSLVTEDKYSKTYQCSLNLISFRSKKIKRELTEEQRKELADRLMRSKSKNQ
jgi:basic membrane lipoprotein Med (substrate-binding protein (PBP1-ABC) superfamily)